MNLNCEEEEVDGREEDEEDLLDIFVYINLIFVSGFSRWIRVVIHLTRCHF